MFKLIIVHNLNIQFNVTKKQIISSLHKKQLGKGILRETLLTAYDVVSQKHCN